VPPPTIEGSLKIMADIEPTAPIATESVPWTNCTDPKGFDMRFRHLSKAMGPQPHKIGVAIEELSPGNQNNPAHYHLREEEHVLILDGALTVRIGKEFHVMSAGDYVRFPAESPYEHCLFNHTSEVCRYIVIGGNDPNDICVYPDSNKVYSTAMNERYMREHHEYWVGEGGLTGKNPKA
jgi:uncharacterized cupin superfamily protein